MHIAANCSLDRHWRSHQPTPDIVFVVCQIGSNGGLLDDSIRNLRKSGHPSNCHKYHLYGAIKSCSATCLQLNAHLEICRASLHQVTVAAEGFVNYSHTHGHKQVFEVRYRSYVEVAAPEGVPAGRHNKGTAVTIWLCVVVASSPM
jgi:hypothetical protein